MTRLEDWLRVERDGTVVAFSGKVDYGQGIRTAFASLVADQLDVPLAKIRVVLGDTAQVPFDQGTYGSFSVRTDGMTIARSAALARKLLLERAAKKLGTSEVTLKDGAIEAAGGRRVGIGELVADEPLTGDVPDDMPLATPKTARHVDRLEARDIVTGRARYVGDLRPAGLRYGAVLHPPVHRSPLRALDDSAAQAMPGVTVVRQGDFVGVVADRPTVARAAVASLVAEWGAPTPVTAERRLVMRDDRLPAIASAEIEVEFEIPHAANAPIGTSVALVDASSDEIVVHAATQRPFGVRDVLAGVLRVDKEKVRVIAGLTTGTYGRNNAPDVAIEAARLSRATKQPVLVEWSRADELRSAPARPALFSKIHAGLDASGGLVWSSEVVTEPHVAGPEGMQLPDEWLGMTAGRNAVPPYAMHGRVDLRVVSAPIRTGALRSLAAAPNVYAIESAIDELARAAKIGPLELRLKLASDPRQRRVLERVAEMSGWGTKPNLGISCAEYHDSWGAEVVEVELAPSGKVRVLRVWCAVDCGRVINPDGAKNQIEGGIVQALSWTLIEELRHKNGRVLAGGWDAYPIATFRDVPRSIEVAFVDDGKHAPTGVGEMGAVPLAGAVANAVVAAGGARVRRLPLTPARVRA